MGLCSISILNLTKSSLHFYLSCISIYLHFYLSTFLLPILSAFCITSIYLHFYLNQIFSAPPLISYRQPPNLKLLLTSASLPNERFITGTFPCNFPKCHLCPNINTNPTITGPNGVPIKISGNFSCNSSNIIYAISCNLCPKAIYIGETSNSIRQRMNGHRSDIKHTAPTTSHLNVVVQSPSLHWGGSKWLVNSPRVSSSGDSPLDNSSHFLSLLSNARSHVDSTLKPNWPPPYSFYSLSDISSSSLLPAQTSSLLIPLTADSYLYSSSYQR